MLATVRRTALLIVLCAMSVSVVVGAASSGQVAEDTWVSKAPMHQARIGLGAAAVNGKIYAIGGNTGDSVTALNEEYDPTTDTWTYKSPMPTPRYAFGIAVYQNKIYCVGGKPDGFSAIGVNEVYNLATDTWHTLKPMPTARMNLQASVVNGKIYLMGGRNSDELENITNFDLNEVYSPLTDTWTTETPMPHAAAVTCASAVVNNKIYVITSTLNMIYDPQNDSWSQGAPPPPKYVSIVGATTGMFAPLRIYTFSETKVQSYDPRTDSWTDNASKPTLNIYPGLAVLDDKFYAIGGWKLDYSNYHPSSMLPLYFQPQEVYTTVNEQYTPIGYGTPDPSLTLPEITVSSPENATYNSSSVSLNFVVNKPASWIGYSLDGQENTTITDNTTIAGLSNGLHNVTVYVNDTYGNAGASDTIPFTVDELAPFPTTVIAATAAATITAIGAAVGLIYFRKQKQR